MILTFDDGPSEWTPQILDLLAAADTRAQFFVIGQNAERHPDLVRRIHAEGHAVGNHTYSHRRMTELSSEDAYAELAQAQAVLKWCGVSFPAIWRAPFMAHNDRVDELAVSLGLRHVGADVQPDDFASEDPDAIAAIVLAEAREDSVVCLHDGVPPDGGSARCLPSRSATVEAVRLILAGGRA